MSSKDRQKYYGDVLYEVWHNGGNPDAVDYDRLDDYRDEDYYPEEAAARELESQRRQRLEEVSKSHNVTNINRRG